MLKCPKCGGTHIMMETQAKVHIEVDDSKDLYKLDDWETQPLNGYTTDYFCITCEHDWYEQNSFWR